MTDEQRAREPELLARAVEPWADYHGDLPDYDHPLRCVFESGIQYAVELLAKELGVDDWTPCEGTEEFDGDLGGTLMNIVLAAMPKDEHGDPIYPRDLTRALTPTPVEAGSGEIELVARALYARRPIRKQPNRPETWSWEDLCAYFPDEAVEYRTDARAVLSAPVTRDGVLEEAAKVADRHREKNGDCVRASNGDDDVAASNCWIAGLIANDIRQLKDKG